MKTTGLFTTHRIEIEAEVNKPLKLIPFGDVHRDSNLHCERSWQEFLEYAKDQKDAIFLGMGDYTDGCSTSERIVLGNSAVHDTTKKTMEKLYRSEADKLAEELSFMKGKLIGLLGGNHYFDFGDGDTTDHVLAAQLGCKFLGVCSFIRLSFRFRNSTGTMRKSRCSLDIFAHHGKGGGTLAGSTFNTVEKMTGVADADIYLMGHDHNKGCIPGKPKLKLNSAGPSAELSVKERTPWYGRTGSFLKAYENGEVSYNVDACRSPLALGWIEFELRPTRTSEKSGECHAIKIRGTA